MMNNSKINALGMCSLIIILLISGFMGTGIYSLIRASSIDGYISIICSFIFGFVIIYMFITIFNYNGELTIRDKINTIFGKGVGFLLNMILTVCFFVLSVVFAYNYNSFISSQFLSETPILFIGITVTVLSFYVLTKGFDTLSRVGLIVVIINVFLYFIAIFGLINNVDLSNFLPIMKDGIMRPLLGCLYFSLFDIVPIFLLLIVPRNNIVNKDKVNKYVVFAYIFSVILMMGMFITVVGSLGIHLASSYQYPEYIVLKRVKLFNFLDRIENVIVIQWLLGLFVSVVLIMYYVANMIKRNNSNKGWYFVLLFMLMISTVFIFRDNTVFEEFCYGVMPFVLGGIFVVMCIVFVGVIIKKRRS